MKQRPIHNEQDYPHMPDKQKRAMYKYFRLLAQALDDAGYMAATKDEKRQFPWKEGIEVSFTMEIVKENMWKPVLSSQQGKSSTEEQTTKNVMTTYDELDRYTSERFGIHIPWPQEDPGPEEINAN